MPTTLPRHFYADPAFYRSELERFYFARWICAGRVDQIPNAGDYFTRTLDDDSVIVTRDTGGAIHAMFNVCRHRGTGSAPSRRAFRRSFSAYHPGPTCRGVCWRAAYAAEFCRDNTAAPRWL
jgi:hypothetical protein